MSAHSTGRPRWWPAERSYVTICMCGKRLAGKSQAEAEAQADAHLASVAPITTEAAA